MRLLGLFTLLLLVVPLTAGSFSSQSLQAFNSELGAEIRYRQLNLSTQKAITIGDSITQTYTNTTLLTSLSNLKKLQRNISHNIARETYSPTEYVTLRNNVESTITTFRQTAQRVIPPEKHSMFTSSPQYAKEEKAIRTLIKKYNQERWRALFNSTPPKHYFKDKARANFQQKTRQEQFSALERGVQERIKIQKQASVNEQGIPPGLEKNTAGGKEQKSNPRQNLGKTPNNKPNRSSNTNERGPPPNINKGPQNR